MKKVLAFLFALLIGVAALTGCGNDNTLESAQSNKGFDESQANYEGSHLLPYGLAFGMEYKKARKICDNFPRIHDAQNNDGYASDGYSPDISDYEAFFGIDDDKLYGNALDTNALVFDPKYYFSFNESKQLYEFCVISEISDSEDRALYLFYTYEAFFTEKLSTEFVRYLDGKNATKMTSEWETDEFLVSVVTELGEGELMVSVLVHSKTFELGSTNRETSNNPQQETESTGSQQQTETTAPPQQEAPTPTINGYIPGVFSNGGVYTSQWLNIKYQNGYAQTNYAPSWEENLKTINSNPNDYRITDVLLGGADGEVMLDIKVQKLSDASLTIQDLIAKEQADESAFFNSNPYTPSHIWTEPTEFNLAGETYMMQEITIHVNYNGQTYDEINWYLYRIKDSHLVIMSGIGQISSEVQFFSRYN